MTINPYSNFSFDALHVQFCGRIIHKIREGEIIRSGIITDLRDTKAGVYAVILWDTDSEESFDYPLDDYDNNVVEDLSVEGCCEVLSLQKITSPYKWRIE